MAKHIHIHLPAVQAGKTKDVSPPKYILKRDYALNVGPNWKGPKNTEGHAIIKQGTVFYKKSGGFVPWFNRELTPINIPESDFHKETFDAVENVVSTGKLTSAEATKLAKEKGEGHKVVQKFDTTKPKPYPSYYIVVKTSTKDATAEQRLAVIRVKMKSIEKKLNETDPDDAATRKKLWREFSELQTERQKLIINPGKYDNIPKGNFT